MKISFIIYLCVHKRAQDGYNLYKKDIRNLHVKKKKSQKV